MTTIQINAQVSPDQLAAAVGQLPPTEREQFIAHIIALRLHGLPIISQPESDLLLLINESLPEAAQHRYTELIHKRQAETLTDAEYTELLELSARDEAIQAKRLTALTDLAHLRHISLAQLMHELGITLPHATELS